MQYISPACEVINVNVQSRFLNFSIKGDNGSIGTRPGEADGDDMDVKGETNFWDEW